MNTIASTISLSEGLESEWASLPIPIPHGMLTYAVDTQLIKRGDGISLYADLPTFISINAVNNNLTPPGSGILWFTETPPEGYLELDGSALSRTTYSKLFAVIGTAFGYTSATTFKLPDLRGRFPRGWSHAATTDPDRLLRTNRGDGVTGNRIGTLQSDEMRTHTHALHGAASSSSILKFSTSKNGGGYLSTNPVDHTGGSETRPTNINVMYCIKY